MKIINKAMYNTYNQETDLYVNCKLICLLE